MPDYPHLLSLLRNSPSALGITVNGSDASNATFQVYRQDVRRRNAPPDITGRPGLVIQMLVNGNPVASNAKVVGKVPAGAILVIGNSEHVLREPLELQGGDFDLIDYNWRQSQPVFGSADYTAEPVLDDEASTRAALRRAASIDAADAYITSAPNETKGAQVTRFLRSGEAQDLMLRPRFFTAAFNPTERVGIPQSAAQASDTVTRMTIGTDVPYIAPRGSVRIPRGWSRDANSFFTPLLGNALSVFSTCGYSMDPGVGVAVFDDLLTESWADKTAVQILSVVSQPQWAKFLGEDITQRIVEVRGASTVRTVVLSSWEIESINEPAAELLTDPEGRVSVVVGFEYQGRNRWHVQGRREIAGG